MLNLDLDYYNNIYCKQYALSTSTVLRSCVMRHLGDNRHTLYYKQRQRTPRTLRYNSFAKNT